MVVMKAKRWRKSVHGGGGCEIVEEEVVAQRRKEMQQLFHCKLDAHRVFFCKLGLQN